MCDPLGTAVEILRLEAWVRGREKPQVEHPKGHHTTNKVQIQNEKLLKRRFTQS